MKTRRYGLKILTTGTLVLILWAIVWFWIDFALRSIMGLLAYNHDIVAPEVLVAPEWNDPDIKKPYFETRLNPNSVQFSNVGFTSQTFFPDRIEWDLEVLNHDFPGTYHDRFLGQIVYKVPVLADDGQREKLLYAGPEGFSETPSDAIGRFADPLLGGTFDQAFVYDRSRQQFFRIDVKLVDVTDVSGRVIGFRIEGGQVVKGPVIPAEKLEDLRPVDIGKIEKGIGLELGFSPPRKVEVKTRSDGSESKEMKIVENNFRPWDAGEYLLILAEDGEIYRLHRETLVFAGNAGRLPEPVDFFGTQESNRPSRLSCFSVCPISREVDGRVEYLGMAAASVSCDGFGVSSLFFDAQGRAINASVGFDKHTPMGDILNQAGGPLTVTARWLAENAQPAGLNLGSIALADAFSAESAMRAMFIRPNSFAGILMRGREKEFFTRLGLAARAILPSLVLGFVIGSVLNKEAKRLGESKGVGRLWFVLGFLFGVPAWITFAVARPRVAMVTCGNCGGLRRPDRDRCHVCKAGWDLERLAAPSWRVKDAAEGEEAVAPAPAAETSEVDRPS